MKKVLSILAVLFALSVSQASAMEPIPVMNWWHHYLLSVDVNKAGNDTIIIAKVKHQEYEGLPYEITIFEVNKDKETISLKEKEYYDQNNKKQFWIKDHMIYSQGHKEKYTPKDEWKYSGEISKNGDDGGQYEANRVYETVMKYLDKK